MPFGVALLMVNASIADHSLVFCFGFLMFVEKSRLYVFDNKCFIELGTASWHSNLFRAEAVTKIGEVYVCGICGNKVKVMGAGRGTLVCCGKPMTLVK